MGIFSRKKKPATMDLPPPPSPEELAEEIKAPKAKKELKEETGPIKPAVSAPRRVVKEYNIPPPPDMLLEKNQDEMTFRGDFPSIRGGPMQKMPRKMPLLPELPVAEELAPEIEEIRKEQVLGVKKEIEPIFIEIGDYQAILNRSKTIRNTLKEAEEAVSRLGALKSEEERIIASWQNQLEDIEKKISYVDEVVFGGE